VHPGACNETQRVFLGRGAYKKYFSESNSLTSTQIKSLLILYGPLTVAMYALPSFSIYFSGVYNSCPPDSHQKTNHVVILYGWDSNGNWLIRNQWGSIWGNFGNAVISAQADCGISNFVGYITVATPNVNVLVTIDKSLLKNSEIMINSLGLLGLIILTIIGL
jgi:hypothetical protein